jgi:AraC-like DNA-binding protein
MAMTTDDILAHPALEPCVRGQAQSLLSIQQAAPRIASVFATQQRWLMAHAALAQYFRNEARNESKDAGAGLITERFLETVERHGIASRNTASAFLKEMQQYDIVRVVANSVGRRQRPLEPAPAVLTALFGWHALHLATLDRLDGGARAASLNAQPTLLRTIQPLIADGLIGSNEVREPEGTFSLFTWVNEGGIVMDRLIAGCQQSSADGLGRIPTDVISVSALAQHLKLSRTQLGRKFAEAEAMGNLGWSGARGKSPLWVSADFRQQYLSAQAVKLAIIDAAFAACAMPDQCRAGEAVSA